MKRRSFLAAIFAAPSVAFASQRHYRIIAPASEIGLARGGLAVPQQDPFMIDGADVRMNGANLGTINSGRIASRSKRMVIDPSSGVIRLPV